MRDTEKRVARPRGGLLLIIQQNPQLEPHTFHTNSPPPYFTPVPPTNRVQAAQSCATP